MNKQVGSAALILCGLALLLITALVALHDQVPEVLNLIAIGALTGGASLAIPGGAQTDNRGGSGSPAPARSSSPAPAQAQAAARIPSQAPAPAGNGTSSVIL